MRLKATVETLNRDVNMKTKAISSLISLGKKPLAKDDQNHDPKVGKFTAVLVFIRINFFLNLPDIYDDLQWK